MTLQEEIKSIMEEKGLTAYRVWKNIGIDQGSLSKFFSGERPFVADALVKLLDYLGYELTLRKKQKK